MREIEVGPTMVVESWIAAAMGVYLIVDSVFRVRRILSRSNAGKEGLAAKSGSAVNRDAQ